MQTTSALWKTLLQDKTHWKEQKISIGQTEYDKEKIVSLSVSAALFGGRVATVGSCVSAQLSLVLWNPGSIPRNAEVKAYTRLSNGTQSSEWLQFGVFYIDTRDIDPDANTITLSCYDAMLKAEQTFLMEGDTGEWPRTQQAVVNAICTRMGVELDSRTVINSTYMVEYPNDYTMREILGYIAAAHGGCWIITPAGKLRLVTLGGLPAETNYLVDENGDAITMGGVRILV